MEGEHGGNGTVCVTGASGFIGSWLVMRLLERGYFVRGTVRDPANIEKKLKYLLELPKAGTHLSLWKADLAEEGSFDDAIQGCDGVFHVATPMFASVEDPENEAIKPTVNAVLNVMRSCSKAKNVKRFIYTSSIATVIMQQQPQPPPDYDESFWTDVDFCNTCKMDGWVYCVAKTMGEKAAWKFAEENGIDLITIQPSIVIGPFITAPSISVALALVLITRNKAFYPTLYQAQAVHIDDVCNAHIYIFEHPQAKGRYICSSHCFTIMDLAKSLKQKYPERNIPTEFEGFDELLKPIPCSPKKLLELGFKFKYNPNECDVGDLVSEAMESCKEKGILPTHSEGEGLSIPSLSQGQEIRKGEGPMAQEIIYLLD